MKIFSSILVVVLLLGAVWACPAAAQTRYVAPTGSDIGNDCLDPMSPCFGIGHAVVQAASGDTIELSAGLYEPVTTVVLDKADLTVRGAQAGVDPRPDERTSRILGGPNESIVDGAENRVTTLFEIAAENVTLDGLDLTGASGDMVRQADSHSGTTIRNTIVRFASAPGDEGIQLENCSNCLIERNYATFLFGDAFNFANSSNSVIQDNQVRNNSSTNGAIYTYGSTSISILNNLIENSSADGGIVFGGNASTPNSGGTITGNMLVNAGTDGILIRFSEQVGVANNMVIGHDTGLRVASATDSASVSVNDNEFINNTVGLVHENGTATLDATNNWWNSPLGPNDTTGSVECLTPGEGGFNCDTCDLNENSFGQSVEGDVLYCPWFGAEFTPVPTMTPTPSPTIGPSPTPGPDFTRYVDPQGTDAGDCTDPGNPCGTIQYAIDIADEGDIISLLAGLHEPLAPVTVNKAGLSILGPQSGVDPRPSQGSSRQPLTGEATVEGAARNLRNIFIIAADDVTLDGLEVRAGSGDLITQSSAHANVTLQNLIVHAASGDEGIQLRQCTDCTITRNYVFNTVGDGINFASSTNSVISENELTDIFSSHGAIYTYSSTGIDIIDNVIRDLDSTSGIRIGGGGSRNDGGMVSGNTITNVVRAGVDIIDSDNITVMNNVITNNGGGVNVDRPRDSSTIVITNNEIRDNGYGVQHRATAGVVDATNNWWGSPAGPFDDDGSVECLAPVDGGFNGDTCDLNLDGTGNEIIGPVRYAPWDGADFTPVPTSTPTPSPTQGPSPTPIPPQTRYVAVNGNDAANDCTVAGLPCASVSHAIDLANPGDTIEVAPGRYNLSDTIVVDKSDLTIAGPQMGVDPRPSVNSSRQPGSTGEAILSGGNFLLPNLLILQGDRITIDGLEFQTATGDMITQNRLSRENVIQNSIVHGSTNDEGIQLRNCVECELRNNYVFNTQGDGLNFAGSRNVLIAENDVVNSRSSNGAIYIYSSQNVDLIGNTISESFNGAGIRLGDAQDPVDVVYVGDNVITEAGSRGAVYVGTGARRVSITGNTLTDSGVGVNITNPGDAGTIMIEDNTISGNAAGLTFTGSGIIDARNNFWGDDSGPLDTIGTVDCTTPNEGGFNADVCDSNPDGLGDSVSENVLYSPWNGTFNFTPVPTPTPVCSSSQAPCEAADTDDSGAISLFELLDYIELRYAGQVTLFELLDAIECRFNQTLCPSLLAPPPPGATMRRQPALHSDRLRLRSVEIWQPDHWY